MVWLRTTDHNEMVNDQHKLKTRLILEIRPHKGVNIWTPIVMDGEFH